MLQGVQQNSVDLMSYAQPQVDTTEATKRKDAVGQPSVIQSGLTEAQETKMPDVGPAYMLEISDAGIQAQQSALTSDMAQPAVDGKAPTGGQMPKMNSAESAGMPEMGIPESSASDDDVNTSSLSQYSASQLQQFLSEGKISRSDLTAELARRGGTSGESTESSSATGTNEEVAASVQKMME